MKKLLFGIMIALAVSACQSGKKNGSQVVVDSNRSTTKTEISAKAVAHTSPPPNTFTLDGTPSATADKMVTDFINGGNEGDYDSNHHTCIWFCKAAFQTMYDTLKNIPNSDGIRFYFAKNSDGKYTAIALPTTKGAVNQTTISGFDHNDYFLSTDPQIPNCGTAYGHLGNITPQRGAILYGSNSPCGTFSSCPPQPGHYINCATAYQMVYGNCGLGHGKDKFNATSEWFDKGIINDLLNLIPAGGGIRLYYAKHNLPAPNDTIARHGFVLILTQPVKDYQKDYFICLPLHPLYKHLYPRDPGDGGTDNGEECPASCGGTTWQ